MLATTRPRVLRFSCPSGVAFPCRSQLDALSVTVLRTGLLYPQQQATITISTADDALPHLEVLPDVLRLEISECTVG